MKEVGLSTNFNAPRHTLTRVHEGDLNIENDDTRQGNEKEHRARAFKKSLRQVEAGTD